jgi:hypothetical protein
MCEWDGEDIRDADMAGLIRPDLDEIVSALAGVSHSKPVLMLEYDDSRGVLDRYWDFVKKFARFQGGFFSEHSADETGQGKIAAKPSAEPAKVKMSQFPGRIAVADAASGIFVLEYSGPLHISACTDIVWKLLYGNETAQSGTVTALRSDSENKLPFVINCAASVLRGTDGSKLCLSLVLNMDFPWADAGFCLYEQQFDLPLSGGPLSSGR